MALEQAGVELVAKNFGEYSSQLNSAAGATTAFGAAASKAAADTGGAMERSGSATSAASQVMIGALRQVGAVAVEAGAAAAKAIGAFVTDSINKAGDFEAGMNNFGAVAGGALAESGKSLGDFKDLFLQLGKELPVSTAEVQEAATEMVKGGIDPATVAAGGLRQTLQFAAAGGLSLADAATIAAKAVGGWAATTATADEKAAFLTHSTDLLAKAANASTVDVKDLALGLYNVQGTAKLAGATFDETVTTLALLAPSFASSADAGTSMKVMLSRLQPTTKNAAGAMMQLGLYTEKNGSVFYDSQGQFIGMSKAAGLLAEATKGLSSAQKESALQAIFGQDAIRAAAVLAEQGAAGYDAMTASLGKQLGATEMAALKQQGYATALDNAKGSVEALQITIGSAFLPVLTNLLNNVLAPGVNAFTNLAAAIQGDNAAFLTLSPIMQTIAGVSQAVLQSFGEAGLSGALNTLVFRLGLMVPGFNQAVALFQQLMTAAQPLITLIGDNLKPILAGVAGVIAAVVVPALAVAVGSFLAVAAPIAAAIAVGALLYKAWESNFGGIQQVVTKVLGAVQNVIQDVISWAVSFWTANGDTIMSNVRSVFPTIQSIITSVLSIVQSVVTGVLGAVGRLWKDHGDAITGYAKAAWALIYDTVKGALDLVSGVLKTVALVLQGDWKGAGEVLTATTKTLWANIVSIFTDAKNLVGAALNLVVANIISIFDEFTGGRALELGTNIINGIIHGINEAAGQLRRVLIQLADDALGGALTALGIHSPSTVFADEVGKQIPAGIAVGAQQGAPAMNNVIAGLVRPSQIRDVARSGSSTQTSYATTSITNQYQLGVTTNQSPTVLRQSFALMAAGG